MPRVRLILISILFAFSFLFINSNQTFACVSHAECNADPSNSGCDQGTDGKWWCYDIPDPLNFRPPKTTTPIQTTQRSTGNTASQGSPVAGSPTCAGGESVSTPFGCIAFDLTSGGLLKAVLPIAVGLGGALSLGLMLYGFFILSTSAGIPDKVKAGQEIITSAVGGLLFIIFSVILMNLIGVKILAIPGL